jgi:hypothetical protein
LKTASYGPLGDGVPNFQKSTPARLDFEFIRRVKKAFNAGFTARSSRARAVGRSGRPRGPGMKEDRPRGQAELS